MYRTWLPPPTAPRADIGPQGQRVRLPHRKAHPEAGGPLLAGTDDSAARALRAVGGA